MCYYVSQKTNHQVEFNEITRESDLLDRPMVSGFTGQPIAVMKPTADRKSFDVVGMNWGLLPRHLPNLEAVKNFKSGYKNAKGDYVKPQTTLNAHSDRLFLNEKGHKSMWAEAVRERRCLVPIDGYYEYRHIYRTNKRTGKPLANPDKYPYYMRVTGQDVIYLGGIWQEWVDRDTDDRIETLAFTTAEANPLAARVHNSAKRMPTMFNTELAKAWMYNELTDEDITEFAKFQFPEGEMEAWPIHKDFRTAADPKLFFNYPDCPALDVEDIKLSGDNTLSLF